MIRENILQLLKNSNNIDFKGLIFKMNELVEISNKHIMVVNKYKLVKDHNSLKNLINVAIYDNTYLLCIVNGLLLGDNDKSVGLFMICLNFVILKGALFLLTEQSIIWKMKKKNY